MRAADEEHKPGAPKLTRGRALAEQPDASGVTPHQTTGSYCLTKIGDDQAISPSCSGCAAL
jgi:hypothetical protein